MDDMGRWNEAKYSYEVHKWFADQPGHPRDNCCLAIFLCYWNIEPNWAEHRFRRKHVCHQVDLKSAMGKMTRGSVGTFHFVGRKLCLLLQETFKSAFLRGPPYLSTYCLNSSFFHEQLLWQSVLIFSCMQELGSSGISQFSFMRSLGVGAHTIRSASTS